MISDICQPNLCILECSLTIYTFYPPTLALFSKMEQTIEQVMAKCENCYKTFKNFRQLWELERHKKTTKTLLVITAIPYGYLRSSLIIFSHLACLWHLCNSCQTLSFFVDPLSLQLFAIMLNSNRFVQPSIFAISKAIYIIIVKVWF